MRKNFAISRKMCYFVAGIKKNENKKNKNYEGEFAKERWHHSDCTGCPDAYGELFHKRLGGLQLVSARLPAAYHRRHRGSHRHQQEELTAAAALRPAD
jgi:hypothetical protein